MDETLLCRDAAERLRLLDMTRRLRPARLRSFALLGIAAIVAVPVYGWSVLAVGVASMAVLLTLPALAERVRRPEYVLAGAWLLGQLAIFLAIAVAQGPREYTFAVLVVPMLIGASVFPRRVVAWAAVSTAVMMIVAAFAFMPSAVEATPPVLVFPLTLLIVITMLAARTLDAEADSRAATVVDQLTGLLNRTALQSRATELTHHLASVEDARVAVIVADVDHFKTINDDHGHAAGDAVLVEVARRLDLVVAQNGTLYRFGGEEFVVLLEGGAASAAAALAERMRVTVSREPILERPVRLSLGVASSGAQVRDYAPLFAGADRALYRAKASGRNRVEVCEPQDLLRAGVTAASDAPTPRDRRLSPVAPRAGLAAAAAGGREREDGGRAPRSLIIRTAAEREHLLDIVERANKISRVANPLVFLALASAVPWFGWWPLVPVVVAVAVLEAVALFLAPHSRRPEYPIVAALAVVAVGTCLAMLLADPAPLFALPFLSILMFSTAAGLPARAAAGFALFSAALMTATALLMNASAVAHNPSILVFPLALLGAVSFFGYAIGQATVDHNTVATTDQLTGLFNRLALRARVAELSRRGTADGKPVSVLLADLDHFKAINDEHGHVAGDRVLVEVAARMRSSVRLFDSVYRIGGEEFLVLLVGLDGPGAVAAGERIRRALQARPVAGLPVTVSIGICAMTAAEEFDYPKLFAGADVALRAAKQSGRDRVLAAPLVPPARPVAA